MMSGEKKEGIQKMNEEQRKMIEKQRISLNNIRFLSSTKSFLGLPYIQLGTPTNPTISALVNAESSEDGRILTIHNFTGMPGESKLQLYVRDEWKLILDRINRHFLQTPPLFKKKYFIVTGTPGIGKSHFKFFIMRQCALIGRPFIYETEKGVYEYFSPSLPSPLEMDYFQTKKLKDLKDCIYLVDMIDAEEPSHLLAMNTFATLLFSSPNEARYHELKKDEVASAFYIMNPLTPQDLQYAHKNLDAFKDITDFNEKVKVVGGVLRHLLPSKEVLLSRLEQAIEGKGANIVGSLNWIMKPEKKVDAEMTYLLVHIKRKLTTELDPTEDIPELEIATPKIKAMLRLKANDRKLLFQSYFPMNNPFYQSLIGYWAEYELRNKKPPLLNLFGLTTGRRLYGGKYCQANTSPRDLCLRPQKYDFRDLREGGEVPKTDVLYYASALNQGAWDAFMISDKTCYFFQVTVSGDHSVRGDLLAEYFKTVQGFLKSVNKCELVFVNHLPCEEHDFNFKIQALTNINKTNYPALEDIPESIRHLATDQWFCSFDKILPQDNKSEE